MNKLLFLLIGIPNIAFSQQKKDYKALWHLTIVDSVNTKGIDKVTVSLNKKRYYFTDVKGGVNIDKALINKKDSVLFSCIGYKSRIITPGVNNEFPDTVRLSSSVTSLNVVKIGPLNTKETAIGIVKKTYNSHRITNPNQTFAQFIPNKEGVEKTITSVEYILNDELHGIEKPFRVRLYLKNKNSLSLDQELTHDSIIVHNPERKRRLSVDISKYNIQFPAAGVIVIFEILSPSYYGKDSIWYKGHKHVRTPGIDMDLKNKNEYTIDHDKKDRQGAYSMVGPEADRWNFNGVEDQWYAYAEGNNFAITLTVSQ